MTRRAVCAAAALCLVAAMSSANVWMVLYFDLPDDAYGDAYDDASDVYYDDGWQGGDHGGFGWGFHWVLDGAGFSVGSSTSNGDGDGNMDGDIDVSGEAWRIATTGTEEISAIRRLAYHLEAGDGIAFEIDNDPVGSPGFFMVELVDAFDDPHFTLFRFGTEADSYAVVDGSGTTELGVPLTDEGLRVEVILTGVETYSARIVFSGGPTISRSSTLARRVVYLPQLRFVAKGDGVPRQHFVNSIAVPEPDAGVAGLAASAVLLGLARSARRARSLRSGRPEGRPVCARSA